MSNPAPQLGPKLWNYRNLPRDECVFCGDYVVRLTLLRFLKMADDQSRTPFDKPSPIHGRKDWPALPAIQTV